METKKLYYDDVYCRAFTARVTGCVQEKKTWLVTLDQTAFYPEGGGQPADCGTLGGAKVLDVQERAGEIVHTCDRALPVGEEVAGELDWARRFDHMQQHSGEHIVSGMLCAAFHCDNVGFHMGESVVTIDYNAEMTWEQVLEIEQRANRYIWENHAIEITWPTREELAHIPYRSKKALEGPVRLTGFPGADLCACCGTHVMRSGEVGLVKFLSCQKFRDGVRLELLCGERALRALAASWEQNLRIGQALSVKGEKTFAAASWARRRRSSPRWRKNASVKSPHSRRGAATCCSSSPPCARKACAACATPRRRSAAGAAPSSRARTARITTRSSTPGRTSADWSRT